MADPAFPDDLGGDRTLLRDASRADVPTVVGDLAAINLQLIHALTTAGVVNDAARPYFESITRKVRQTVTNVDATKVRETNTRVLKPLTRVPADNAGYGPNNRVDNIKLHGVTYFDGSSDDPAEVSRWLGKVLVHAEAHGLTDAAAVRLLVQGSIKTASDYIEQMRDEGKNLLEVVQQLEMRYGNLCTKEEARVKCNNMPRPEGMSLSKFLDDLRYMAKIACRYIDDQVERVKAMDELVQNNILRVLPTSVKAAIEERILTNNKAGLPPLTARELEKECIELERLRLARRDEVQKQRASSHRKPYGHVRRCAVESDLSDPELSSAASSEEDPEEEQMIFLVDQVTREKRKFTTRGLPVDTKKVYKGAFKKFNERYHSNPQGPRYTRQRVVGEVTQQPAQAAQYTPRGPPSKMNDPTSREEVLKLLDLARCKKGQCIQCGMEGHLMKRDACPLRGKPLVNSPCAKCGTGLHSADDCVRTFQTRAANLATNEYLN